MRRIIISVLCCALFSVIFISCSREYLGDEAEDWKSTKGIDISNVEEFVGERLENPYSVKNMRKAYISLSQELLASTNEQSPIKEEEIKATDYYVRFLIEENSQLEKLESDSLNLSILPLNYEIKEGDIELSAKDTDNPVYWMYTSVPVNYEFPKNDKIRTYRGIISSGNCFW